MNDEKWYDLKTKIQDKFKDHVESVDYEEKEDGIGNIIKTKIETLEFMSPLGEMQIIRKSRPKILDKKSHYHKGAGAAKVEYILSKEEMHHQIEIFKKDDTGEWVALELPPEKISF